MNPAARRYAQAQRETASPERLMVLLFQAALRHIRSGAAALESGQQAEAGRALGRASDIVVELHATLDRPSGTMVAITNRSPLRITGLVLTIEITRTCRNQLADGSLFTFTDRRQGTVRVAAIEPNARVEVPIDLQGQGPCPGFRGTDWSATWRIVSAKMESPQKP